MSQTNLSAAAPAEAGAGLPLDARIEAVVAKIKTIVAGVELTSSYLNNVADVYRKHSPNAARVFVIGGGKGEGEKTAQVAAPAMRDVLAALQDYKIPQDMAVFIIKKLDAIQKSEW